MMRATAIELGQLHGFHDLEPAVEEFRAAVLNGLSGPQKRLPAKFFYDAEGSRLFDEICDLPEYYPTRTETGILRENAGEIAEAIGPDATLVEFGSGSSVKIRSRRWRPMCRSTFRGTIWLRRHGRLRTITKDWR